LQTFVEQKLDFLLREYFGLSVPFYLHAGVYTRPDAPKSCILTALLHRSGGFLNVVARGVKEIQGSRSVSRTLAKEFISNWQAAHPNDTVTYRDIGHQFPK
jgi:hypothetical protein